MTTPWRESEEGKIARDRKLGNLPIEFVTARWDGHRSLRLRRSGLDVGLATTAYSYSLTGDEKLQAARRLAALWTLAATREWTTDEIERMAG